MSFKTQAIVLLASVSVAAAVWAQSPGTSPRSRLPLDELMKADVLLEPTADAKQDAAQKGERADKPKGKVKDFIISTRGGQVSWAALSVGGLLGIGDKIVLVPASALKFDMPDDKPRYELRMTEAQLKALPDFNLDKAEKEGLDAAVDRVKNATGTPVGAPARPLDDGKSDGPRLILASRLKSSDLNASDKEFGKVANASVDTRKNQVDYLLVSHGGALGVGDQVYVVPYAATTWTRIDDKPVLKLSKTNGQLMTAPEYKKPDKGFLTTEQMKLAHDFFGLPIDALVD